MFATVSRVAARRVQAAGRTLILSAGLLATFASAGLLGGFLATPEPAEAKVTVIDTTGVRRDTLFLGSGARTVHIGRKGSGDDTTIVIRTGRSGKGGHVEISQRGIIVDDSDHGGDVVRMGDDIHVKPGEVVGGDVVSIGGSVTIDGTVLGDAVSIGGDMSLGDSAVVAGDAVSIGGGVTKSASAKVGGESVQVGVKLPSLFNLGRGDAEHVKKGHGLLKFFFWVVFYLVVFAFAALVIAVFRDRLVYAGDYMRKEPLITFLLGTFSPLIFFIGMILLMITIIGIPVAAAVAFLYPVLVFVGWVVAGYRVGGSVRQTRTLDVRTVFTGLLVISAVHMLAIVMRSLGVGGLPTLLLGIVGYGASLLAALIGLGAILGTRFRRPPLGPDPMSYGPLPPSPGPMMPSEPIVTSTPPPSA